MYIARKGDTYGQNRSCQCEKRSERTGLAIVVDSMQVEEAVMWLEVLEQSTVRPDQRHERCIFDPGVSGCASLWSVGVRGNENELDVWAFLLSFRCSWLCLDAECLWKRRRKRTESVVAVTLIQRYRAILRFDEPGWEKMKTNSECVLQYSDRDVQELWTDANSRCGRRQERIGCVRLVIMIQTYGVILKIGSQWRHYGVEMEMRDL